MKYLFLFIVLLAVTGCYETAAPTTIPVAQFPATWTPAPTDTTTPPPPTATLVIQRTPKLLATRDPNARVLPSIPRDGIGLWLETNKTLKDESELLSHAQIILTNGSENVSRQPNQMLILSNTLTPPPTPLAPVYGGVVANPGTGDEALDKLRAQVKPRLVFGTAPISDTTAAQSILAHADGIVLTGFLRDAQTPLDKFPDEAAWKHNFDALNAFAKYPNSVVLISTEYENKAQGDLLQQWFDYAFASYLLSATGTHMFFRLPDNTASFVNTSMATATLGTPTAAAYQANGVYQRRFTRGLVAVNPSASTRSLTLPFEYKDSSNNPLARVEMQPHSGIVLLRTQ
jgi:hypothetical protein